MLDPSQRYLTLNDFFQVARLNVQTPSGTGQLVFDLLLLILPEVAYRWIIGQSGQLGAIPSLGQCLGIGDPDDCLNRLRQHLVSRLWFVSRQRARPTQTTYSNK